MSTGPAMAVRSWPVGPYRCTLSLARPRAGALTACTVEWAPRQPASLSAAELSEYRAGRDQALAEIAEEIGVHLAAVGEL